MIAAVIRGCVKARIVILLLAGALLVSGIWAVRTMPVDALPDLSDVQVIIRTSYPGQAPQIVEDQVTYPLAVRMLSVPGARTVRGYSFNGDSYVYVIFDDGTDLYWARSRVLEYLNQVQSDLPLGIVPSLGPDATGVGWIYEYALIDRSGSNDLSQLRSLQDWFLRYELQTIPGVAEVASIGGMIKQYQVVLDPSRMVSLGITQASAIRAIQNANSEVGGSIVEMAEREYIVRATGYLESLDDFRAIPLKAVRGGVVVTLGDIARIQTGPAIRRGIAELDGEGEVVGGVIILRSGKNARETIAGVKEKLAALKQSLPPGVEVVTTYDRSELIDKAVETLSARLLEEIIVVALVCGLFLWHVRSALVAVLTLPLGIVIAFLLMRFQGISANIMSLGGIAIAIGAMVDAAIVMIENAHKHFEKWQKAHPGSEISSERRWQLIVDAAIEVGPALFFSLLIITFSFLPIFALEGQEGRLFSPLVFTKTYAMAVAALLSVTLIPVLMGYFIRGKIPSEDKTPVSRFLIKVYEPALSWSLKRPKMILALALLVFASSAWPLARLGGEFMPQMDEGDLLYMPNALPGLSPAKAAALLQQTNRLIKSVPEVETVFGKVGRADTATDPAPLTMFETTIHFKPRAQWRAGMTPSALIEELDKAVRVPGLANFWIPPIRNRIEMLSTGIKSPIGIKVSGDDLEVIDAVAQKIERTAKQVDGVRSALAERLTGGSYIDVKIDRIAAGRYGLNISDVQSVVSSAIGGRTIGEIVEGPARYPISLRYPRAVRGSLEDLRNLPILTPSLQQITLGMVAEIAITSGPPMLRSENGRSASWVYIDTRDRDLVSVVADLQATISKTVALPAGVSIAYSGQFEYLERGVKRLMVVVPATLVIIFILLYVIFGRFDEALLIMGTLPFALTGGLWLIYAMGLNQSIATAVGFIALAGVSAEFGVVMLIYLKQAVRAQEDAQEEAQSNKPGGKLNAEQVKQAIRDGAVLRIRPKAMTVAVILAGLFPILIGEGAGSEVMLRIASPMVGGMLSAPFLSLFIVPAAYYLLRRREASPS